MKRQIPCVILCGGKSSRMGKNKDLLPFGNETLLQYQFHRMKQIFQDVFVSCKTPLFSLPSIVESSEIFSPLIGIKTSLEILKNQKVFFICVDTPLVQKETIMLFLESKKKTQILYFKTPKYSHYLVSLWDKSTLPFIEKNLCQKDYSVKSLIEASQSDFVFYQNDQEFSNLNTRNHYNNALAFLKGK